MDVEPSSKLQTYEVSPVEPDPLKDTTYPEQLALILATGGAGVGFGVGFGVGLGVGFGVGTGVGTGVGAARAGAFVGFGVGLGVGDGVGVGLGVGSAVTSGVGIGVATTRAVALGTGVFRVGTAVGVGETSATMANSEAVGVPDGLVGLMTYALAPMSASATTTIAPSPTSRRRGFAAGVRATVAAAALVCVTTPLGTTDGPGSMPPPLE